VLTFPYFLKYQRFHQNLSPTFMQINIGLH